MSIACPQCGEQNLVEAKMCSLCGIVLQKAAVATTTASIPPSPIPMPQPMSQPRVGYREVAPSYVEYAGFWLRFVASIIDGFIVGIVGGVIGRFFGRTFLPSMGAGNFSINAFMGALIRLSMIIMVLKWLYFALMESSNLQGTLGKMVLGLAVTDLDGNPISFGRATGRFFGKIVSGLILDIGYIMAGFTEQKQALHDMMAGCLVVRK